MNGDRPRPVPMALGHEAAGEVVEIGRGVDDLLPGDHVVMIFVPSCGHCLPFTEGRRSEERRVGKECVSTCRSRWSPFLKNTNIILHPHAIKQTINSSMKLKI